MAAIHHINTNIPPQALPLEEAVLGAVMIDRNAFPAVLDILRPQSFYGIGHGEIYKAFLALYTEGSPIDILTVTDKMTTQGTVSKLPGGGVYLVELTNRVASAANLEYHARIVKQKEIQRDLIDLANRTLVQAHSEEVDVFDLLYETQKSAFSLSNLSGRVSRMVGEISGDVIRSTEAAMRKGDGITGVPSGLEALDQVTGGWQNTDLIVIAARPGMGKTSFVMSVAKEAALAKSPVAFFSLEMSQEQLTSRLMSMITGIDSNKIRRGKITEDDLRRMVEASQAISTLPLHIDDTPALNIFELRARSRRMQMQYGIQLIIVDYLQLMSGTEKKGNREGEVSEISRGLKALARELNVPVIALSQLSRAVETRGGSKRPQLSDLRESGAIEQDSDLVGFIYRPEYYDILEDENGNSLVGVAEFLIEKHRHGALETVGLRFDARTTNFSDISKGTQFPTEAYNTAAGVAPNRNDEDVPF